jgi:hypothetical protein
MGHGKSFYGVRSLVRALSTGKAVVTNIILGERRGGGFVPFEGWAEKVAQHMVFGGAIRPHRKREFAAAIRARYYYEPELDEAQRYRMEGRGERRMLFVWDESHNDLNNRDWRKDGREELLAWATQLRKLGFAGVLVTQHRDNTDAALRRICSFEIRMKNQRELVRLLGMRVTPFPLFIASWYPANIPAESKTQALFVERFFLSWERHLYDTFGLYHGLAEVEPEDDNSIWLDSNGRRRPTSVAPPATEDESLCLPS